MSLTRMTTTPKCRKTSQAQGPWSTVHGPNPEGADSRPKKFKIGPYTVVDWRGWQESSRQAIPETRCNGRCQARGRYVPQNSDNSPWLVLRTQIHPGIWLTGVPDWHRLGQLPSCAVLCCLGVDGQWNFVPTSGGSRRCWMPTCMELTGPPSVPYPCGLSLVRWPGVRGGQQRQAGRLEMAFFCPVPLPLWSHGFFFVFFPGWDQCCLPIKCATWKNGP